MQPFDQLYQEVILEHAAKKNGYGSVDGVDASSHQTNPTCGDEVTLGVVMDGDTLASVVWEGQGCSISQASLSMMTELVVGQDVGTIDDLRDKFTQMMHSRGKELPDEVLDPLEDAAALQGTSQFPNRVKCALLGWMALRDAMTLAAADSNGEGRGEAEALHC